MLTLATIAGVVVAMLAVQALVLLAHSLQNRMGTMPIGMVVAILTFGTWVFAGFSPYVELSRSVLVPLLSVVLYSNLLCLVLTVYVCDGTNYTRRLLLIVLATYLLTFATLQIMEYASYWGTIKLTRPIPAGIFISNWRARLAATLAMAFSFLLVPALYQLLTNRVPSMARTLRAAVVLVTAFTLDGLIYLILAFAGKPFFSQFLISHTLVKIAAALILVPGVAIYTNRVLRAQARGKSEVRPLLDVVSRVTEMDRELETLLATMVDGLILFTQDGTIVRANAAAERLIGQPLAGRRLDDPILRMSHPDGSRFPHTDSPLQRTLRARTPIENVELAFQRHDGGRRIMSVNASPLLDSKRRLRGGMATFRDVTQRREIDESLAASQDFLRRLIEQAPVGIGVFDAEGLAEHLNKRFLDYLSEKNPNQLLGRFNIFQDSFLTQSDLLKNVILAYKGKVVEIPPFGVDVEKRQIIAVDGFFSAEAPAATTRRIISALLFPINDRFEEVRNVVVLLTDLTERYRAEHQQRRLEERYQRIVTRVSDYIFSAVVDFDTFSYEFCTPSVEKITGYSDDFFMQDGWFWFKIINHDDQSRVQDELLKIITKGADEGELEYRIRHRLQGTRWVRNHLTVLRNEKDRVDRVIGVVSDITSQKNAEAALRRTVDRFRALVENLNELLFTSDLEARISFVNKAFKSGLGHKERSVLGASLYDYLHPDEAENLKVAVTSHLETGKPIRAREMRIRRRDGHYLTVIANADLIYDEHGAVEGSLWVAFDVTEIRRAEQVYRSLFENAVDGIYRATLQGKILAANPALVNMLGYSDERALLSLNFAKDLFCSAVDSESFHQRISSQEFVHGFETRLRRQDNTTVDVRINVRQIKDDFGEVVHLEGDVDNVSEEKALRKQLFQAQRLQGLSRVAGGLAHDFNGYLNSIMGSLTLVKPMLQNDQAAGYLQEAEMAATRGAELVRRLFTFSRASGGGEATSGERRPVHVDQKIAEAVTLFRSSFDPGIEIQFVSKADSDTILADESQINQLIMNLAGNAHDAIVNSQQNGGPHGRITIVTELADLDQESCKSHRHARPGRFLKLSVTDTGHGIDEEILQHIYEPFFTTKKGGDGIGLGLSVVYGIVQELNGWMDCTTAIGEGTTFDVFLPAHQHGAEA